MARIAISKDVIDKVHFLDFDNKVIIYNDEGNSVACLYVLPDGNLHEDSWVTVTSSVKNGLKGTNTEDGGE